MQNISIKFSVFLLLLLPVTLFAQKNYIQQIDEYMQAQAKFKRFNGNVLVADKGQIIYQKSFGYADYDTKQLLNDNSVFELASVSKQFTAMCIMILKEKGKLDYSDNIRKYIPELPYEGITIRHLLTHTSGLPEYEELFEKNWDHHKVAFNNDEIALLKQYQPSLLFKPGTRWKYSNTGYTMLASIVERISGMSWNEFTAKNIFIPLGMAHTRIYNTRRSLHDNIADYAYGYVHVDSLKKYVLPDSLRNFAIVYYLDGIVGDGVVNSTTNDLLIWDRALYTNTLVPLNDIKEATSVQAYVTKDSSGEGYGFGWFIHKDSVYGNMVNHSGGWPGYSTYIARYIDHNKTIIVLSNNESPSPFIGNALGGILFGEHIEIPYEHTEVKIDPAILDRYVGKYKAFLTLEVIKKDGKLYRHREGTPDIELKPESNTKFFYADGSDRQLEFEVDRTGKVIKIWFINNGQRGEMQKLE
jgi:CubicO group peptidase (beta-lactamase class C family)